MKESQQTIWVGLSFLAVGLTIGLLLTGGGTQKNNLQVGNQPENPGSPDLPQIEIVPSVSADDDPFLGDSEAPVTIVEFSDFQCPFCLRFVSDSFDLIKENYIDTGIVKFVYRDFPLSSHPQAHVMAEAAECVSEQAGNEAYFEMHDALFASQTIINDQEDPLAFLKQLALDTTGVDITTCIDNGEMVEEVDADFAAARGYGVSGTPTFFINGQKLVGAYPYEVISELIENAR